MHESAPPSATWVGAVSSISLSKGARRAVAGYWPDTIEVTQGLDIVGVCGMHEITCAQFTSSPVFF